MSQTYTLIFVNNSSNPGDVCVYQKDPNIGAPDVMSLAWFAQFTNPGTTATYSWGLDYSFVWAQTGTLQAGVQFSAGQNVTADLSSTNQITLDYNGAYLFTDQTAGAQSGTLYITETGNIPLKQAAVGIGMSGAGTFVVQAQPNLNLTFTPHPEYWITFGSYMKGEVLDVGEITGAQQIQFPPNVYSMTATLNPNNSWTVQPTSQANAAFLEARKSNPSARWGRL